MPTADELLGRAEAERLMLCLRGVTGAELPSLARAVGHLDGLALSARASALADAALEDLPGGAAAIASIRAAVQDPELTGWVVWPAGLVAARAALGTGRGTDFDDAMAALAELTPRCTSEFSIRPLLAADPRRALRTMLAWTGHPDTHVRRLASEGSRPYLPWGQRVREIVADPDLTAPILEALRGDPEEYVRRSVANHLNDHSRTHGAWVLETVGRWNAAGTPEQEWIARHGLRTLIKRGDPGALELLGFGAVPLAVSGPVLDVARIPFGGSIAFGVELLNEGSDAAKLAVDFALLMPGARGETRRKVFKWATPTLAPGEKVSLRKEYSFRPISTRRYYPGAHGIEVLVNGASHGPAEFEVLGPL